MYCGWFFLMLLHALRENTIFYEFKISCQFLENGDGNDVRHTYYGYKNSYAVFSPPLAVAEVLPINNIEHKSLKSSLLFPLGLPRLACCRAVPKQFTVKSYGRSKLLTLLVCYSVSPYQFPI